MACTSFSGTGSPIKNMTTDILKDHTGLQRSLSSKDLCREARIRRSCSDNHLCYSASRIQATSSRPKLKNSRSMGIFNFQLSSSIIPNSLRSILFDPETSKGMDMGENLDLNNEMSTVDNELDSYKLVDDSEAEMEMGEENKRANWIERLLEIRSNWREKQQKDDDSSDDDEDGEDCDEGGGGCEVDYSDDEEEGKISINRESFSRLLRRVSFSDTKLYSQLAFLCNMAYVIQEIKPEDLRRYYDLELVTSSLEKKAEAAALKAKFDEDSTRFPVVTSPTNEIEKHGESQQKRLVRSSVAYEIAASAASYVHSRAKGILALASDPQQEGDGAAGLDDKELELQEGGESPNSRVYKPEVAAYVAASTMTSVVAAGEKEKLEAAKDLQSLHSSPCDWFVCDDSSIYTRCFVIQGSDSVASWHANLFFEPAKFEGTEVLVHRGIYEAAKGIYEQFMPEIIEHLNRYGERAKFQFTGHSLGGSLSLLVNLMLLTRKVLKPTALLPVVTFGSPFVFCGGQKIFDKLGLDENHVHCVIMHRDIVPRAFSCNYPNQVAQLLKRINGSFRSHPCLNKNAAVFSAVWLLYVLAGYILWLFNPHRPNKKLLYAPMGKIFILQPDEKSSPPHPLLPPGSALYTLDNSQCSSTKNALRTFLNSPHPIVTLSNPTAYGADGTILRDHDSSNYLKAVNGVIRQHTKMVVRKVRKQRHLMWPLLTSQSPHAWSQERNLKDKMLVSTEVMTGV